MNEHFIVQVYEVLKNFSDIQRFYVEKSTFLPHL